jgi:anaerobic ribonucleoside-triphosphate reductase
MLKNSCPGSIEIRQPKPEEIKCRKCGASVEIWSDETEAKCRECGQVNSRILGPSCIDWCAFAKECVGEDKYKKLKSGQNSKN